MKKMFLFLGLAVWVEGVRAATCPASNFIVADDYIQIADSGDACSTYGQYIETDEIKIVADGTACLSGYTGYEPSGSTPEVIHGYCDTDKGSCKTTSGYDFNCS